MFKIKKYHHENFVHVYETSLQGIFCSFFTSYCWFKLKLNHFK